VRSKRLIENSLCNTIPTKEVTLSNSRRFRARMTFCPIPKSVRISTSLETPMDHKDLRAFRAVSPLTFSVRCLAAVDREVLYAEQITTTRF
jgi:hypothetical protein